MVCSDGEADCLSPFRLSGLDVDGRARRPKLFGEDVHPHLHLSLEWRWIAGWGLLASVLSMLAWGSHPRF